MSRLTAAERRVVAEHCTPAAVQRWLRALAYNREDDGKNARTLRGVVRTGSAHCLEAALAAAAVLDHHGYPPLVLDLESQDQLDHVLFLYRVNDRWGTVAKSRDAGLHGRRAVFRSLRDLVWSYVDPYVDGSGRIVGYGVADLDELVRADWRLAEGNVFSVERALLRMPHRRFATSDGRYERTLARYLEFRAAHPDAPATYYRERRTWL